MHCKYISIHWLCDVLLYLPVVCSSEWVFIICVAVAIIEKSNIEMMYNERIYIHVPINTQGSHFISLTK